MKVLSIDTASNICGVSLLENTKLICHLDTHTGRTHSENLMPMIQEAFTKTNLRLKDIDLIVCDIGPGSFTGLRIGIATVKAFADSLLIPCIGISSLEGLAYPIKNDLHENDCICSLLDCKNDNCYFAFYEKKNGILETLFEPQAETLQGALSILKSYCEDTLKNISITFVGDGSEIYQSSIKEIFPTAKFASQNQNVLNSYFLALAGLEHYHSGVELPEILPLYLKKPQAERQLEEREKHLT
ncbi:MAG: tRNA (adenosine(37)-N6)-threonylcarbamoyltransferase complex dimerization subunit type 1 TsaB [Clostridia bacterium]|nr:tRNA (adenosine(37)-N6)-threonylcarbamoyltransferase complex dimerization subunit type 1 TsaB [Clostridia bacterium]